MDVSRETFERYVIINLFSAVEPDATDKMIGIHQAPSPFCPVGKSIKPVLNHAYDKVKQDLNESMKRITLDSMVEDFHLMLNE